MSDIFFFSFSGQVGLPKGRELILSTERLNRIIQVDAENGFIVCEAGCVLQALQSAAAEQDMMVPVDLGAKGGLAYMSKY